MEVNKYKSLAKPGFQSIDMPVKDKLGNMDSKDEDKLKCRKEHFKRLLNRARLP